MQLIQGIKHIFVVWHFKVFFHCCSVFHKGICLGVANYESSSDTPSVRDREVELWHANQALRQLTRLGIVALGSDQIFIFSVLLLWQLLAKFLIIASMSCCQSHFSAIWKHRLAATEQPTWLTPQVPWAAWIWCECTLAQNKLEQCLCQGELFLRLPCICLSGCRWLHNIAPSGWAVTASPTGIHLQLVR